MHVDDNDTLDKTWQEIHDAVFSVAVYAVNGDEFTSKIVTHVWKTSSRYYVEYGNSSGSSIYSTNSPDGYPVFMEQ